MAHYINLTKTMNEQINLLELRIFRAVEEPELANDFFVGHHQELASKGLNGLDFVRLEWANDPNVYIMALISGKTIVGGSRIHLYHPDFLYPFEEAVLGNAPHFVNALSQFGSLFQAEWCGLWLSSKYRGLGVAETMNRTAIAACHTFGLDIIYGICPRHTMDLFRTAGFRFLTHDDELISFPYPTEQYISYIIQCEVKNMEFTFKKERKNIQRLINDPEQRHTSSGLLGECIIQFTGFPEIPSDSLLNPIKEMRWGTPKVLPSRKLRLDNKVRKRQA